MAGIGNISTSTSIFYDLQMKDNIGHKMISTIECEKLNPQQSVTFCRNKMKAIIKKYPHFGSRIINHNWMTVDVDYNKLVYYEDKNRNDIVKKMLNTSFQDNIPAWLVIVSNDNCLIFICDHTYGDGALISQALRSLFDDDSFNNTPKSSLKKKHSILSKIILFFKIIFLLFKRFKFLNTKHKDVTSQTSQIRLATLSLTKLKNIRDRFTCSDGSKISINDLIHAIIVKTNSLYFNKELITSAAMFNLRGTNGDYDEQNKLGYLLLANESKNDDLPETVLKDIHDFMQFYKETPATYIITYLLEKYYYWNREGACRLLQELNQSVDFIISNLSLNMKEKTLQHGIKVQNIHGTVTPCDASQMYSVTSYGDNVNIFLTYRNECINDISKLQHYFNESYRWLLK